MRDTQTEHTGPISSPSQSPVYSPNAPSPREERKGKSKNNSPPPDAHFIPAYSGQTSAKHSGATSKSGASPSKQKHAQAQPQQQVRNANMSAMSSPGSTLSKHEDSHARQVLRQVTGSPRKEHKTPNSLHLSISRDQSDKEFKTPPLIENSRISEGRPDDATPGGGRVWKGGSPSKLTAAESPTRRAAHNAAFNSYGPSRTS